MTPPVLYQIEHETLRQYIVEHIQWSREVFGEGNHTEGLLKHIEKEIQEVRSEDLPVHRCRELVDIIILALDAMWREGFTAEEIVSALIEKQNINKGRKYPKITDPGQPTEHLREEQDG
jgi:hypothetical protein